MVKLDFSRPGKPTDNAFIESFNGVSGRNDLTENWFLSPEDTREKLGGQVLITNGPTEPWVT